MGDAHARVRACVGHRPRSIIRLTGRPSSTPISSHSQISQRLSLSAASARKRARLSCVLACSLRAVTATPETGIAQAGVGFMFAEPVGNSCRLTYSYCPALARARARDAARPLALRRSALPAYSQWCIYSCWCPKRWLYLEHSLSPRELVGSSCARARAASLNQRTLLLARSRRR